MKKIMISLLCVVSLGLFGQLTSVEASNQTYTYYNLTNGNLITTEDFGAQEDGRYSIQVTQLYGSSSDFDNGEIVVKQRSVAGASGSSNTFYYDDLVTYMYDLRIEYHAFIYGDEDIYFEITVNGISGYCNVEINIDPTL